MAGMVPIPGGVFWVYLTGVALILACISLLAEKKVRLAGILLGVMLLIFVLSMHLPEVISSGGESGMSSLLKDTALAGAAWYIAGQYESESSAAPEAPSAPETGGEQHSGGEQY